MITPKHGSNSIKPIVCYKRSRFGKYASHCSFGEPRLFYISIHHMLALVFVLFVECVHGMLLHMMWTTPAFTLRPRHLQVLQSYFHHHPNWHLRLYITDTNWANWRMILRPFYEAGYSMDLVTIDEEFLTLAAQVSEEATVWLENHEKWKTGPYYYSHLTDLLRFTLLYRDGGVYSDFDALLLRPMPIQEWLVGPSAGRTVIGRDRVPETCDWCLTGGMYLAPGVMLAERGSQLLKRALEIGFGGAYDPTVFNHAGPRAITMASKQVSRDLVIQLPSEVFYPVNYKEATQLFKAAPEGISAREMLERIKRRAVSLHFFGAQTKNISVEKESIMDILREGSVAYHVTDGTSIHLDVRASSKSTVQLEVDFGKISPSSCSGDSVAEINQCLSTVTVTPDPLFGITTVKAEMDGTTTIVSIYNLSALLTVTVKTMDRMHKVFELVSSLRQYYPNLPILVANDGSQAFDTPAGPKRGFTYLPLPYDTGLSEARNIMVDKVETPLMMILDDDFVFTEHSDLGYLVHQLISNRLDIVAASSPADRNQHGFNYVGLLERRDRQVHLIHGDRGGIPGSTCVRVDLVPNIFVARRVVLEKIRWDPILKLGEHEDFFLRAMEADIKVANCRSVELTHRQDPHWLNKTPYDRMRSRVWGFLKMALQKHSLDTLSVFGMTTMAIQGK
ncbi:hypothetical protein PSACC_00402 [Paramicrosporidium saccamoebae]|uniref:Glycosyltransferase 2-like domain-containing protein n=1 Tax=Paramicrosporidium saccamoebae TaxID=1246581 RepID=A0A2H9TPX8_9FUNG|nr:hypothetical protein PSACC_00402 [Paramicrosporidium saccamoebae]